MLQVELRRNPFPVPAVGWWGGPVFPHDAFFACGMKAHDGRFARFSLMWSNLVPPDVQARERERERETIPVSIPHVDADELAAMVSGRCILKLP